MSTQSETSKTADETKVYNLLVELEDMKKRKRIFNKAYQDEIKRIQQEIQDILDPESAVEELP